MIHKKYLLRGLSLVVMTTVFMSCNNTSSSKKQEAALHTTQHLSATEINTIFKKAEQHLNNAWDSVQATQHMPRSIERGFRPIKDWTSGFYPGNLWIVYQQLGTEGLLQKAQNASAIVEDEKYNTKDHDIGFRIYCPYGRGYELTKSPHYKEVIIQAAKSAIQRYNPTVKAIQSWEPKANRDWKFPVIIDNMMNLELLFAASKLTNDTTFYNIAVNHAKTTMVNQYRSDNSCSHVVDYDPKTGEFRKRDYNNGNNDPKTAAWSRGQSWGLYGFTMVYRETQDEQFLKHAEKIAEYILNHPNLPADMVPYWDYNAPETPTLRDSSAAAIMASGFIELAQYSKDKGAVYFNAAEKILKSLASKKYLAEPNTNGDFLLKHATGNYLKSSERDGTLIYADYYFLEALERYLKVKHQFINP